MVENKSILVVGTVRNVEKTITNEINRCIKALNKFKKTSFFIVESDSSDNTLVKLENLKKSIQNFSYTSLGNLVAKLPDRLERIRYCRNSYVEYIRTLVGDQRPNYVLVVDLDGMNSSLNSNSILSCFERNDWDSVVSNQTFGYYDILALRHPVWQPNDWSVEFNQEKKILSAYESKYLFQRVKHKIQLDRVKQRVLYSKMIRIKKKKPWVKIDSGFGGAAIYKIEVFDRFDYSKEFETTETDHVSLHRKLTRNGGVIYINPKFINSHFNTYNLNRYFLIRFIRGLIWNNTYIYNSKLYSIVRNTFKMMRM